MNRAQLQKKLKVIRVHQEDRNCVIFSFGCYGSGGRSRWYYNSATARVMGSTKNQYYPVISDDGAMVLRRLKNGNYQMQDMDTTIKGFFCPFGMRKVFGQDILAKGKSVRFYLQPVD